MSKRVATIVLDKCGMQCPWYNKPGLAFCMLALIKGTEKRMYFTKEEVLQIDRGQFPEICPLEKIEEPVEEGTYGR
jgi:hypothetical protein